mgnify:CR=1 FL=1
MGRAERARRARGLRRLVLSNPPERWLTAQLDDLLAVEGRRTRLAMAG